MKIYISGRITGLDPDVVKQNFAYGCELVSKNGFKPVNPLKNGLLYNSDWKDHLLKDIEMILDCDGIFMLSDWKESKGARIEHFIAKEIGLFVTYQSSFEGLEVKLTRIKEVIFEITGYNLDKYLELKKKDREIYFIRLIFVNECLRLGLSDLDVIAKIINRDASTLRRYKEKYDQERKFNKYFRKMAQDVEDVLTKSVSV
jgi:hypothetical protein